MDEFLKNLPVLYSGLAGLLGGVIASYFAFRSKKVELKYNAEFKASELIYKTYEQQILRENKVSDEFNKQFGSFSALIVSAKNQEEEDKLYSTITKITSLYKSLINKTINEKLKEELIILSIFEENKNEFKLYMDAYKILLNDKNEDPKNVFIALQSMQSNDVHLRRMILEAKCEQLFSKYIKE